MSEDDKAQDAPWEYTGPESLTLTFDPPLMVSKNDAHPVESITLTEPTAQHLSVFLSSQRRNDDAQAGIDFIAANSGVPPPYIKKMRARDFGKALDFLGGFTQPGTNAAGLPLP